MLAALILASVPVKTRPLDTTNSSSDEDDEDDLSSSSMITSAEFNELILFNSGNIKTASLLEVICKIFYIILKHNF